MEFNWSDEVEFYDGIYDKFVPAYYVGKNPLIKEGYIVVTNDGRVHCQKEIRKRRPDLKVDDRVLVRAVGLNHWLHAHFKEWAESDGIICFDGGRTSWTSDGRYITWKEWKLPCD